MDPRDIAALIEQNLPGSKAHVQTDGQGHYEATVVAAAFAGKRSLQRHQLVTAEPVSAVRYRYNTQWDASGEVMAEVAASYRRHLVPLATFIHSRASTAVREFARAFDLKKDR